jgi:hypothetical protein
VANAEVELATVWEHRVGDSAVALLDRAYGKAPTFSTSDAGQFKRAIDLTDDELAAIIAQGKLRLVKSE